MCNIPWVPGRRLQLREIAVHVAKNKLVRRGPTAQQTHLAPTVSLHQMHGTVTQAGQRAARIRKASCWPWVAG
jgi:hypothetical protein